MIPSVGASLFIPFYTAGVIHFGFTAVFEPIANEFNWSYVQISLAASLRFAGVSAVATIILALTPAAGNRVSRGYRWNG